MATDTDLAYLAGLIDGEGYVGIRRNRAKNRVTPGYHARIQVRMVDEPAIAFLASTLGGHYYRERRERDEWAKGDVRALYCFSASDASAERILRAVLPYLRVKRQQAENALALRELQRGSRKHMTKVVGERNFPNRYGTARMIPVKVLSDEYIGRCEELRLRASALNGR